MRRPLLAANWKMNKTVSDTADFFDHFKPLVTTTDRDIVICPPFVGLQTAAHAMMGTQLLLGAQNVHDKDSGAFTGEVSASMLAQAGCGFVIVGHSERREYNAESNAVVNAKLQKVLSSELGVILCVGESLAQREANETLPFIESQLTECLAGVLPEQMAAVVIAYEPIWAIGTGKTATPEMAQAVHAHIRSVLEKLFSADVASTVRILYGGSVKPENIADLMGQEDIDGALVGGASLTAESFAKICMF